MARADFHAHTHYSSDGLTTPQQFVARCVAAGIDHVAVTDHGTIAGAQAVAALAPFRVIVGEEVRTTDGELLGLFLTEPIPNGLSAAETAERIHRQGGLVVAPHPFDPLRPGLGPGALRELGDAVDAVEGYNGRTLLRGRDRRARAYAEDAGLPLTLGSDAHVAQELGRSCVELPDFDGPRALLGALSEARYRPAPPAPWWLPLSGMALAKSALGWDRPQRRGAKRSVR